MIFQATLSNKAHPEYGVATVAFPIPRNEYDRTMELLEGLGIGDAKNQDCEVASINSKYPVLNCLSGQSVKVDELDYLAKRLDSFSSGEDDQFQAMAHKLNISDIRDFINLTFSCQEVTVITDFSDLAKIGKDHSLIINGGSMSPNGYNKLDGEAIALDLIQSGKGEVTPFGVVYDNGMKLEQAYDGRHFPLYFYEIPLLNLEIKSEQHDLMLYKKSRHFPLEGKEGIMQKKEGVSHGKNTTKL